MAGGRKLKPFFGTFIFQGGSSSLRSPVSLTATACRPCRSPRAAPERAPEYFLLEGLVNGPIP